MVTEFPFIGHTIDREYTTDVQPSDMECHQRSIRREFESNTGVLGHRTKYTGHINTRVKKEGCIKKKKTCSLSLQCP
jgi:hypothetical protein